jgi:predicted aspartyl protease
MSTPYLKTGYASPIPTLPVRFIRIGGGARTEAMLAIADTGADLTIVPLTVLEQLGALKAMESRLVSQWGDVHPVTLYIVDVQVEALMLPAIYVAGDDTATEVILGRDLLNKLPLFLDGPEQQTTILDEATAKRLRAH